MKIFLTVLSIMMLSFSITFAGTLKVTNNSSNADIHKLWKETIIPTFEKENPDIKVEMTIYDHEAYCLLYTSPSPRDKRQSRMPSSA